MSGGSFNYAYYHVQEMAMRLKMDTIPYRRAFAIHLEKVAKAMHAVEWVDSDDYSPGDDEASIKECFSPETILNNLRMNAEKAREELDKAIREYQTTIEEGNGKKGKGRRPGKNPSDGRKPPKARSL